MSKNNYYISEIKSGLKDGLPIGISYIPLAFAFGATATHAGFSTLIATFISASSFTSASQFAGINMIMSSATLFAIAFTTLVLNIRYLLMSMSFSQIINPNMGTLKRCILSFVNTDEGFAVAMKKEKRINFCYFMSLSIIPYSSWVIGTFVGATASSLLPESIRIVLNIAVYSMFVAIMVPAAKKAKPIAFAIIISIVLSCTLNHIPFLNHSPGWIIIICAIVSSSLVAIRYPAETKSPEKINDNLGEDKNEL